MSITTIRVAKLNVVPVAESYAIALSFDASEDLVQGTLVKIDAAGTVSPVANDGSELPLGIVTRGSQSHVYEGKATVLTNFAAVLNVTASGAVAIGDKVIFESQDAATKEVAYKTTTTAGNIAAGIALSAGADGATVQIGILRTPYTLV